MNENFSSFSLEPSTSDALRLVSLGCVHSCSKFPRQFILIVQAYHRDSSKVANIPVTIHLNETLKAPPKFRKAVVPIGLKERLTSDYHLILEVDDQGSDQLIFSLNDYDSVFQIDANYGVLTIRVSQFSCNIFSTLFLDFSE